MIYEIPKISLRDDEGHESCTNIRKLGIEGYAMCAIILGDAYIYCSDCIYEAVGLNKVKAEDVKEIIFYGE